MVELIDTLGPCLWFVRCTNPATHLEPHPVIGDIPCCDRCSEVGQ